MASGMSRNGSAPWAHASPSRVAAMGSSSRACRTRSFHWPSAMAGLADGGRPGRSEGPAAMATGAEALRAMARHTLAAAGIRLHLAGSCMPEHVHADVRLFQDFLAGWRGSGSLRLCQSG